MRRSYRKSILSIVVFSLSIPCLSVSSNATVGESNDFFDMDIAQLMQITITSLSKKPQNLSDSAAAVYVITQDDIHRSGVTSIPEALRMAPGLQVARVDSNKWAITSRGFSGSFANKLLVMIDGRTVYSPAFSGVYWDAQDTMLEDVDRIEVIRGPGATVWGANAVNGVVNIITRKAGDTQGGLVSIGGGTHDQAMAGLRYGAALGENSHGRAYFSYHKQDSFELLETGADANDNWDSLRTGFRLDGERVGENFWTLQGDFYSNNEKQTLVPFWIPYPPYLSVNNDDVDASGWNILGRWQKQVSQTSSWTVQAYYDYTNRDESIMEQTHRTLDLDLQYQHQAGTRNNLVLGFGYRLVDTDFGNTFQVSVDPAKRSDNLYSGFLQDEIMLATDRLWLTLGAKWEHNDFTGHEFQPSGRLLWKASDKQTVWAAVSRAVRTPSQFEESGSITLAVIPTIPPDTMKVTLNGNENYDSEDLIAYEAGYRWLALENVSLDVAIFYNDYDNLQTTDPIYPQSFNELTFSNKMSGSTYGLELASDWKPANWLKFQFGYTYLGFDLEVEANSFSSDLGEFQDAISPKHQFSIQSAVNVNKDLQFNLWARYVDSLTASKEMLSISKTIVDAYLTLDANVSWRPAENLELMLVGQNLLNSSHLEYVSEFSTPLTEIERSVYGKLTYYF
jgi:iron complex outermembrane receptor protein